MVPNTTKRRCPPGGNTQVQFRVPNSLIGPLDKVCNRYDMQRSGVVRAALAAFLTHIISEDSANGTHV